MALIDKPIVSVLMAVYNGERYLRESIESVLSQTFTRFEFIIVDDGSQDCSRQIMDSYDDPRIVRLNNPQNVGLVYSLNAGLRVAQGVYIARQDADDVSLPGRIERQVEYLDSHRELGVLGTWINIVDTSGKVINTLHLPCSHNLIHWSLFFSQSFAHPSVMMRKSILQQVDGYSTLYENSEDYELWTRLVEHTGLANLPETLVHYRQHDGMTSIKKADEQRENTRMIHQHLFSRFLSQGVLLDDIRWMERSQRPGCKLTEEQIRRVIMLILKVYWRFKQSGNLTQTEDSEIQKDMLVRIIIASRCEENYVEIIQREKMLRIRREGIKSFPLRLARALVHPKHTVEKLSKTMVEK